MVSFRPNNDRGEGKLGCSFHDVLCLLILLGMYEGGLIIKLFPVLPKNWTYGICNTNLAQHFLFYPGGDTVVLLRSFSQ